MFNVEQYPSVNFSAMYDFTDELFKTSQEIRTIQAINKFFDKQIVESFFKPHRSFKIPEYTSKNTNMPIYYLHPPKVKCDKTGSIRLTDLSSDESDIIGHIEHIKTFHEYPKISKLSFEILNLDSNIVYVKILQNTFHFKIPYSTLYTKILGVESARNLWNGLCKLNWRT